MDNAQEKEAPKKAAEHVELVKHQKEPAKSFFSTPFGKFLGYLFLVIAIISTAVIINFKYFVRLSHH